MARPALTRGFRTPGPSERHTAHNDVRIRLLRSFGQVVHLPDPETEGADGMRKQLSTHQCARSECVSSLTALFRRASLRDADGRHGHRRATLARSGESPPARHSGPGAMPVRRPGRDGSPTLRRKRCCCGCRARCCCGSRTGGSRAPPETEGSCSTSHRAAHGFRRAHARRTADGKARSSPAQRALRSLPSRSRYSTRSTAAGGWRSIASTPRARPVHAQSPVRVRVRVPAPALALALALAPMA